MCKLKVVSFGEELGFSFNALSLIKKGKTNYLQTTSDYKHPGLEEGVTEKEREEKEREREFEASKKEAERSAANTLEVVYIPAPVYSPGRYQKEALFSCPQENKSPQFK